MNKKLDKIKKFAHWASEKIGLEQVPEIDYSDDHKQVIERRAYGSTNNHGVVWVYIGNREAADIMRTLCHELLHVKQFRDGTAHTNMTSKREQHIEDQANALAGRLMRKYGKLHSNIYESKSLPDPKNVDDCCRELRAGLLKLKKYDYDTIDRLMTKIADKYDITPKELHNRWVKSYKMIPDTWIKKYKNIDESYVPSSYIIEKHIKQSLSKLYGTR